MTDPEQRLEELHELVAYIAEHYHRIPRHQLVQAVLFLERVERLIPHPAPAVEP